MRILIATGIFPPEIGGPATYAKHLSEEFERLGHKVKVATYGWERALPTGFRHLAYLIKALPKVLWSEKILTLDTYSVGLPIAFATVFIRRPFAVRIGGDFLWELYVERTHEKLSIPQFYEGEFSKKLNLKENLILIMTKFFLSRASRTIFTTEWLLDIWARAYEIDQRICTIIENTLERREHYDYSEKNFLWAGRGTYLKNLHTLRNAFLEIQGERADVSLECIQTSRDEFLRKLSKCYAVVLPSFSEVSPNFIHEAIAYGKPFIVTKYSGLAPDLESLGLVVDPFVEKDIVEKIIMLADPVVYAKKKANLDAFTRTRPWSEVATEYMEQLTNLHV